jgi:hypothetical protein
MHEENISAYKMLWGGGKGELHKNLCVAGAITYEETENRSDSTAAVTKLQTGQPRNCTHGHGTIS